MDTTTLTTLILWFQTSGLRILLIVLAAMSIRFLVNQALAHFESAQGRLAGMDRLKRARTLAGVVRSLVLVAVAVVAGLMILREFGVDTTPLVAGASIVGIALGLGAQSLVRDMLGGFFILVEEQYSIGDVVRIGQVTGTVEDITLRASYLRDLEGALHLIPNGEVRIVANLTRGWAQALVEVTVPNDRDVGEALEALTAVCAEAAADEAIRPLLDGAPAVTGVEGLDPTGARLRILARTRPGKQWEVARELRRRAKLELDAAGELTVSFPREVMVYRGDEDPVKEP